MLTSRSRRPCRYCRTARLLLDNHARAFISKFCTFELLNYERHSVCALISITVHEAFLNKVEALTSLGFMLLTDVLWSISEACLFEEVEFWALVESRVAIVFVGIQKLHRFLIFRNTKLIKFVYKFFLLLASDLTMSIRCLVVMLLARIVSIMTVSTSFAASTSVLIGFLLIVTTTIIATISTSPTSSLIVVLRLLILARVAIIGAIVIMMTSTIRLLPIALLLLAARIRILVLLLLGLLDLLPGLVEIFMALTTWGILHSRALTVLRLLVALVATVVEVAIPATLTSSATNSSAIPTFWWTILLVLLRWLLLLRLLLLHDLLFVLPATSATSLNTTTA